MQLNDILEENSLKAISTKTKIAEENLEYLISAEFDMLSKVKTLGFISILEREYKADLTTLRAQAEEYYGEQKEEHLFPIGQPVVDEHKSKSKLLILFIILLIGVSSWYFFTQFDKKNLNGLIPLIEEETVSKMKEGDLGITPDILKITPETITKSSQSEPIAPLTTAVSKEINSSEEQNSTVNRLNASVKEKIAEDATL